MAKKLVGMLMIVKRVLVDLALARTWWVTILASAQRGITLELQME
jgi:hypothetical protein